jgi:putative membrane protein
MRVQWTLILALLFALITAIFAVVNVEAVPVNFLFSNPEIPLILVILGSTLLGGLIVGLFGIIRQYRLQKKIKELEKELKKWIPNEKREDTNPTNEKTNDVLDNGMNGVNHTTTTPTDKKDDFSAK